MRGTIGVNERNASAESNVVLLFCHATGFCKEVWQPLIDDMAAALGDGLQLDYIMFDLSGHGDSRAAATGFNYMEHLPIDCLEVVDEFAAGKEIIAVGHSLGAAALVCTEIKYPGTFLSLILYEPILKNSDMLWAEGEHPLAKMANKRRAHWDTMEEADTYFRTRKNFAAFDKRVLNALIVGCLREVGDGVELKCSPASEAANYAGGDLSSEPYDRVGEVVCPVDMVIGADTVVFGPETERGETARYFAHVASRFGNAALTKVPNTGHFLTFEHPASCATLAAEHIKGIIKTTTGNATAARL